MVGNLALVGCSAPPPAAAGGGLTWTDTAGPAIQSIGFATNVITFSSAAVNNPATANTIVVTVSTSANGPTTGVTIGGDAMTSVIASSAGTVGCSIWRRTGNIYTTPNIVVTTTAAAQFVGITVGYLENANTVQTDTDVKTYGYTADPQSPGAITIPTGGIAVAVLCSETGANDPTWNNGTEDFDLVSGTSWRHTSGSHAVAGAFTLSISNFAFAGSAIAIAAWGA